HPGPQRRALPPRGARGAGDAAGHAEPGVSSEIEVDSGGRDAGIKVLRAADAVVEPSRATGGEDATADGTQHDPPTGETGEEPPPDRGGAGAKPDDDQPRLAGTGRSPAGAAPPPLQGRPLPPADRAVGGRGADGRADARPGAG